MKVRLRDTFSIDVGPHANDTLLSKFAILKNVQVRMKRLFDSKGRHMNYQWKLSYIRALIIIKNTILLPPLTKICAHQKI